MLGLSTSFLLLSYWLTWLLGGVGFILANCCNMALRIIHSLIYIHGYFQHSDHTPLSGLRPHPAVLITLTISSILTAFSEVKLKINKWCSVQSYLAWSLHFFFFFSVFQRMLCCESGWLLRLAHVSIGAVCLLVVVIVAFLTETRLVQFIRTQLLPKYSKKRTWTCIIKRSVGPVCFVLDNVLPW